MLQVSTQYSEDMAWNSKWKILTTKSTAELIIYPDSDSDVCDCDQSDSHMPNTDIHDKEQQPIKSYQRVYIQPNKNQTAWNCLSPELETM